LLLLSPFILSPGSRFLPTAVGAFWQLSLVGNKAIVEGFRAFIACFVATNATVRPTGNVFRIGYTGRAIPRAVARVLYRNATIYLDRKNTLAKQLCGEVL
jgi:hypothetical protein